MTGEITFLLQTVEVLAGRRDYITMGRDCKPSSVIDSASTLDMVGVLWEALRKKKIEYFPERQRKVVESLYAERLARQKLLLACVDRFAYKLRAAKIPYLFAGDYEVATLVSPYIVTSEKADVLVPADKYEIAASLLDAEQAKSIVLSDKLSGLDMGFREYRSVFDEECCNEGIALVELCSRTGEEDYRNAYLAYCLMTVRPVHFEWFAALAAVLGKAEKCRATMERLVHLFPSIRGELGLRDFIGRKEPDTAEACFCHNME